MNRCMKQSTWFILLFLLLAISCSPRTAPTPTKAAPTPTVGAPTPLPLLEPSEAIAVVQLHLISVGQLLGSYKMMNAILASKGEAKYLGDRLWEVHFTQSQVRFEMFIESLFLDSMWYVWEPGRLVEPANDEAMLVLIALEKP